MDAETTFTIFPATVYPQACYEGTAKKLYNKGSKIRPITYTPDFVDPNGKFIIETKGYANESFPLRWKLFKQQVTAGDNYRDEDFRTAFPELWEIVKHDFFYSKHLENAKKDPKYGTIDRI